MLPTVRQAVAEDMPGILELLRGLAAERNRSDPTLDEKGLASMVFGNGGALRCLVVPSGGRIVAAAFLYPGFHPLAGTRGMHVVDIYVDPNQRRHSLGRFLTASAARACQEEGGTWLSWSVENGDEGAFAFCEHVGGRPLRLDTPMVLEGDEFEDLAATAI